AGGLLASIFSLTIVPEVRSESLCERLQCRQKAMSLATFTSSLGMTPFQRGQVGVTDNAEVIFSSNRVPKPEFCINSIVEYNISDFCASACYGFATCRVISRGEIPSVSTMTSGSCNSFMLVIGAW